MKARDLPPIPHSVHYLPQWLKVDNLYVPQTSVRTVLLGSHCHKILILLDIQPPHLTESPPPSSYLASQRLTSQLSKSSSFFPCLGLCWTPQTPQIIFHPCCEHVQQDMISASSREIIYVRDSSKWKVLAIISMCPQGLSLSYGKGKWEVNRRGKENM